MERKPENKVNHPRKTAIEHRASRCDLPQKRGTGHGLWFCERFGVPEKVLFSTLFSASVLVYGCSYGM